MDAVVMTPEAVRHEMREVYGDEIPRTCGKLSTRTDRTRRRSSRT